MKCMTAFDPNQHPRGQARNAGQYRGKENSAPEAGIFVRDVRTGERDIELPVLHTTAGGEYVVVDNRKSPVYSRVQYAVFHVGTGKKVSTGGSEQNFSTQKANKEFAQDFEDAGLFDSDGKATAGVSSAAASKWVRDWDPAA